MKQGSERQGAAYNAITHFVLTPLFLLSLGGAIYLTARHRQDDPVVYPWLIALSFGLILLNLQSRLYALRLQDRVIRLEEQLRLSSLVKGEPALANLTKSQLIGLRFAPDAEVPALALQAAKEGLTMQQIKERIMQWRPDTLRV